MPFCCLEAALFLRKLASHFYFWTICLLLYSILCFGSGSKSGSVSVKAKSCGFCGFGSPTMKITFEKSLVIFPARELKPSLRAKWRTVIGFAVGAGGADSQPHHRLEGRLREGAAQTSRPRTWPLLTCAEAHCPSAGVLCYVHRRANFCWVLLLYIF